MFTSCTPIRFVCVKLVAYDPKCQKRSNINKVPKTSKYSHNESKRKSAKCVQN